MNPGGARPARSIGGRFGLVVEGLGPGLAALGWTALAAEAYSFLIYFLAGRPFRPWSFVKIGWLYLLSFSRVGLKVTVGGTLSALINGEAGRETIYTFHLAFLLGTGLAAWLLFRAGRTAARRVDTQTLGRALAGASVAIPYAGLAFLGSLPAVVRFPAQGLPVIRPIPWQALVFPLLMAGVCGGVGGLAAAEDRIKATPAGRRAMGWAHGGWRGLLAGLALSLVGLLVLAALYPGSTGAYSRWLVAHGHTGALVFAHQILSLPNHALFILTPAMGGCDTLAGGGHAVRMLCADRFVTPQLLVYIPFAHGVPGPQDLGISSQSTPPMFRLFLIVPLAAAMYGGRWAAGGLRGLGERAVAGVGAGVVFAVLVVSAAWLAGVILTIPPTSYAPAVRVRLGPELPSTALLALAWGLAGGVIGGLSARSQEGVPVPVPEPLEPGAPLEPVEPEPPRPTSV